MAEQLAFHQFRGNGATVDRHKCAGGPWAIVVNEPRDHFLAAAGFTVNMYRRLTAGQFGDLLTQGLDGGGGADKVLVYRFFCAAGVAFNAEMAVSTLP